MGASERDEFLRAAWRALVAGRLDARRFVFVDECSTNTSLSPIYGWSRRGSRVRELIEGRGCELHYLPPYSPDLNPIEEAFAKIKALLRRVEARTREALLEAMGWSLDAVSASDARGFFEHRGYRLLAQPL